MIRINSPEMIIFIGIPASGKRTFYEQNFAATHERISLDILKTRFSEDKRLMEAVDSGKSCVIDNTNVSVSERKKYIDIAQRHRYKIIGYYFRSAIDECRIRNDQRQGKKKIPEIALRNKIAHLERPSKREGFDELFYVKIENNNFAVSQFQEV
jgi:predicted kinase